jgi:medium-chain acyl-[acyl-carrier-protein] hydrolase
MKTSTITRIPPQSPWVVIRQPNTQSRMRLFCFPNAGGGSMTYLTWPKFLPEEYEICAVQPPGRESRLMEPTYKRLLPMVEDLALALRPYLDRPFAFFGHSMGGKIAFEVARYVRAEYGLEPFHLFVSGCRGPQMPRTDGILHDLPKAEFIEELRKINGTPKEVLEHAELMQLMLPLLRADFELIQTYTYKPGPLLRCPVTAFGGLQDTEITRESLNEWRKETMSSFVLRMLPGDHFFINSERSQLLHLLSQELNRHEGIKRW